MEVILFAGSSGIAFLLALAVVLSMPALYGFLGLQVAKRLDVQFGRVVAGAFLLLFLAIPISLWVYEWSVFKNRCENTGAVPITHVLTKVNGLAFELGYPQKLIPYFGSGILNSSSFDFSESKRNPAWYNYDIGNKLYERCSRPKQSMSCEFVESPRSEFFVKGGDVHPVSKLFGQYESVLQVVRSSNSEVVAERRLSLFGGGVLGLLLGFSTGSQHVACEAGNTRAFPWLGRQMTSADIERVNALVEKDVQFILSVVEYRQ